MATKILFPSVHPGLSLHVPRRTRLQPLVRASADGTGKTVDENMIVLRMRIREAKMAGSVGREDEATAQWAEWEKRYREYYEEEVLEGIGCLQRYLMSLRPSLALAFVALFTASVLLSSGFAAFHVVEITKRVVFGFLHT